MAIPKKYEHRACPHWRARLHRINQNIFWLFTHPIYAVKWWLHLGVRRDPRYFAVSRLTPREDLFSHDEPPAVRVGGQPTRQLILEGRDRG